MKKFILFSFIIFIVSSVGVFAGDELGNSEKLNSVFKSANELIPGTYERWEEVRNYRENLKDEIIQKKRQVWVESAEDREAMKESIELEEEYLLHQYNEGIIDNHQYGSKLKELHDEQNRIMVEKNQRWLEEVKADQEAVDRYKNEMKESFDRILKGLKDNNKVKVENAFNQFIESYSSTTNILHDKLKNLKR